MLNKDNFVDILVLGTAQDGGYPHSGCFDDCCKEAWADRSSKRLIASMAILTNKSNCFLIDITPDFKEQLFMIKQYMNSIPNISGILITHAHLGHYMGLLELGLESMNTNNLPVYVMPRMKDFLENNDPFTQLINLNNIRLISIGNNENIKIAKDLVVKPFEVPHRNEFSETIGCSVFSKNKSVLYIPDIDSWSNWDIDINNKIIKHDIAFLDGTFYDKIELKNRDIGDVPHPSIIESMKQFSSLDKIDRKKVNFIHLNHTNNVLRNNSYEKNQLIKNGFQVAEEGMSYRI